MGKSAHKGQGTGASGEEGEGTKASRSSLGHEDGRKGRALVFWFLEGK